jgi:8-oxo-dGTP pyrophosphatase MutT (NUDIX family)
MGMRKAVEERFNPRASAIVLRAGRVLLSRAEADAFWALPGGRIEPGETSGRALLREMAEELGLRAHLGRLVWVVENRFAHGGRRFHEIGFCYLVDVPEGMGGIRDGEFRAVEPHLRFRWVPLADLAAIDLRPAFLRQGLTALPDGVEHVLAGGFCEEGGAP